MISQNHTKAKAILYLILVTFAVLISMPANSMTNAEIEGALSSYKEDGFKYVGKAGAGMWKVQYSRPGWEFGWEVIVATTDSNPDNSIVVIGTTVISSKALSSELMMKLLDENSLDTNPGSYSVFKNDDVYFVQYAIKVPQSLLINDVLKEGIGFVAGYSNKRVRTLEKMLPEGQSTITTK